MQREAQPRIPDRWLPWTRTAWALAALASLGTVGALIAARRPHNRIGWFFCYIGLVSGIQTFVEEYAVYALLTRSDTSPAVMWVAWIQSWFWVLTMPILLLPLVFPDGQLLSPRWRFVLWLGGLNTAFLLFGFAFAPLPMQSFDDRLNPYALGGESGIVLFLLDAAFALLAVTTLAAAAAMFVRFRRSKGEERQQLKWFTYAAALAAIIIAVFQDEPTVGAMMSIMAMLALPVATGIAILRYRLWDIDILIRRTLIYGVLTAMLALVYFGSVVVIQQILRALTGQSSEIAIVISTLAIAALFTPLRRRVQEVIDRRFFRKKYDAQQVLAKFALTARDETDLAELMGELQRVVVETMQPEGVGVWLKPTGRESRG